MRTNSKKNDVLFEHLKVLCEGYSTGRFDSLFPLLAEDCVFESQWVLTPHKGKAETIERRRSAEKGSCKQRDSGISAVQDLGE